MMDFNLYMIGFMGTGKTTVSQVLAEKPRESLWMWMNGS